MIDSTKSPVPAWKRYGTMAVLAVLVVVGAYLVYTKDIHKSSGSATPPPVAAAPAKTGASTPPPPSSTTTLQPISSRDPFGG